MYMCNLIYDDNFRSMGAKLLAYRFFKYTYAKLRYHLKTVSYSGPGH